MSDLELTYQIYRYAYFIIIILAVIAGICDLVRKSNKDAIAFQYKQLLKKYNAQILTFYNYEMGIDGIPGNLVACVFLTNDSMGVQFRSSEYNKIFYLDLDQIKWLAPVRPAEYIDIDVELPPCEYDRSVIYYKTKLSKEPKYLVFNTNLLNDSYAKSLNDYIGTKNKYYSLWYVAQKTSLCPARLIHSKKAEVDDINIVEL